MRIEEVIGRRMKFVRELNEMTQEQVGEQLGAMLGKPWSRQAVSLAEQGKRAFTAAELVAIAAVVGTTVSRLFTPPLDARAIELPTGVTLTRSEMLKTALPRDSADKVIEQMRETLVLLAQTSVAASEQTTTLMDTAHVLYDQLELAVQALAYSAEGEGAA